MSAARRLPIGLQTFRELRERGCYYVDKTGFLARLVDEGKHHFLSRPRRFGKSLLLDTLKELFEGNEPLFDGLAIHARWDWSVRRPVVRLDYAGGNFAEPGYLHTSTMAQLAGIPYEWHTNNDIARFEGYYASVFYSYFAASGLNVTVEDSTSRGRADMAVRFGGAVYLFEFKVVELAGEGAALAQLKARGYADKYPRRRRADLHLIGVEFSREARNVTACAVEAGRGAGPAATPAGRRVHGGAGAHGCGSHQSS